MLGGWYILPGQGQCGALTLLAVLFMVSWPGSDWKALGPGEYLVVSRAHALARPVQHSGIISDRGQFEAAWHGLVCSGSQGGLWGYSYMHLSRPGLHSSSVDGYTSGL